MKRPLGDPQIGVCVCVCVCVCVFVCVCNVSLHDAPGMKGPLDTVCVLCVCVCVCVCVCGVCVHASVCLCVCVCVASPFTTPPRVCVCVCVCVCSVSSRHAPWVNRPLDSQIGVVAYSSFGGPAALRTARITPSFKVNCVRFPRSRRLGLRSMQSPVPPAPSHVD